MSAQGKTYGDGLGKGHGTNSPNLPRIRETNRPEVTERLEPGSRSFKMGRCHIIASPPFEGAGWHVSISRPDRYPSWDEIAKAWYELVPESEKRTGVLFLPPKSEYINVHNFCFHIHEVVDGKV